MVIIVPAGLDIAPQNFDNNLDNTLILVAGNGKTIFKKMHNIATHEDNVIQLRPSDTVIIASPAVPGTEREESSMEDDLYKETPNVFQL